MKLIALTAAALLTATVAQASELEGALENCYKVVFVANSGLTYAEYEAILADPSNELYGHASTLEATVVDTAKTVLQLRKEGMSVMMVNLGVAIGLGSHPALFEGVKACNDILL